MHTQVLDGPGDLFLGSNVATALALGPRRFRTVANALRFAMEHAAPVSLRGAMLRVGNLQFGPGEIRRLHSGLGAHA